jgi:8-oxo-dGTP pyrophosphatase MutT (NUDIX family)
MKTQERVSAGGVAFRTANGTTEIAVIRSNREGRWQLPKGIVDPGETEQEAALREVREEAGIDCEILEKVECIDYWYVDRWGPEPVRVHKYVHFFLMKFIRGDIADHDHEVDEVRWISQENAAELLAFPAERSVVEKAIKMIG